MAESQKKATPSTNKKDKGSLLDIDIGDDFLGSWKSMSMAGDGMDFDFGPPTTKGKKKDFSFDKMDMDFNLDAGFGKLSSFKTDMSDFDISSPIKKSGNSKEKSKEVSSSEKNQAKRDDFAFSFDFDEFGGLDFGSKKKKTDEKCEKSKDKETSSNTSGDVLVKDVNEMKDDDTSSKNPISKVDTQMDDIKSPDPINENDHLKSSIDQSSNAEEPETQTTISSEKMISSNFEEATQESHSSDDRSSPQHHAQKVLEYSYGHSLDTDSNPQEVEEDSGTLVRMVDQSTGDDQNVVNKSSSSHTNVPSEKTEMCKERDDNGNLLIGNMNGDNTSKGDSHLESSMTSGRENLAHVETVDKRNADFVSKPPLSSIESGPTSDELASEKERGNNIPTRSKYFKIQNGSESEKKQEPVSLTKLVPVCNKRMSTLPNNPPPGKREFGSKSVESSTKFSGISRPLPNMLSKDIPGQSKKKETGHANVSDNTRECLNGDNIKPINEPKSTTVAHDIGVNMEEPASRGRDQNTVHSNPIRSDVHPSTVTEKSTKDVSKNSLNLGLQGASMKSTPYNMGKLVVEKNQVPSTKAEMKTSGVSSLGISRATEPKLKSLNSLLLKGSTSMTNKEKVPELQGKMVFKRTPSVVTKNQTPPPPSTTQTLKRKTFEASAETPRLLNPLKRLSTSPLAFSNNITPTIGKAIGQQMRNHADVAHQKSPILDASLVEIDIYSAAENDALFEQAEACSKELDAICNMLKKKHEEAKDVLVRALVNNNNLLILNHPIYQDKIYIRMIQKFATSLSLN